MNKKMFDILACPIDKHSPLEMFEVNSKDDLIIACQGEPNTALMRYEMGWSRVSADRSEPASVNFEDS